ncbi:FAD-binding oxidoreductase [Devosia naphthalenivorans]|uniref:FAD-binding oxidoreductase n=1 Tax=Devosia naphthalenivorans TaxID=2082392 RepID=UPI001FE87909|nr:FAD-binding oxidoreductase [Devosia naphthalenivorans]
MKRDEVACEVRAPKHNLASGIGHPECDIMNEETITSFAASLRGPLIRRGDAQYDEVRKLYNGMIDKQPMLIARCADVADIIAAVDFGRDNALAIAIRGGGHSGPGLGSVDDGLMIDLSMMKGVHVDPADATVRVEPGCTSGDVDHATHAFGLAVPFGIVSTTGVGGLTLGGGTGYLTRQHGLTIDNLIAADVILADGTFKTASQTENPDLLWALRGGGGNFGVVTSFVFRAHPVKNVFAGPIFWDAARHGATVMRAYRDFLPNAPEALGSFVGLKTVPSMEPFPREHWGKRACAVISCFNGPEAEGKAVMAKLIDALPEPLFNWMATMPFPAIQGLFDPFFPKGLQWYWKGDFVNEFTDEAIEAHIAHAANAPSELSLMHLYPIDGAVHRVGKDETPWAARDARWSMVIAAIDANPQMAGSLTRWGRDYWEAVHQFNPGGAYVNFMMDDEGEARVRASYGDNYQRLVAMKGKFDPANLFHINQNIRPSG